MLGMISVLLAIVSMFVVFWAQEHVINGIVEHQEMSVACFNGLALSTIRTTTKSLPSSFASTEILLDARKCAAVHVRCFVLVSVCAGEVDFMLMRYAIRMT